jgi:hypothetical protein
LDSEPVPASLENACNAGFFLATHCPLPQCCKPLVKNFPLELLQGIIDPLDNGGRQQRRPGKNRKAACGL